MTPVFLGLGAMGAPMAAHLLGKGYPLKTYNRGLARRQQWQQRTGQAALACPAEAVTGADLALLCLGADEDVREVMLAEQGVLSRLAAGAVVVDHSTTSAALAREMASICAERGISYLDAPVSGGQAGAEAGQLTIMVGGDAAAFARVEPVLASYAAKMTHLGANGSGQLAKMVNQICVAGLLQGLAEGLHFGQSAGLDMAAVLECISAGAAQSWQMSHRGETMLAGLFDFGFAVDWMRKDLKYVLQEAAHQQSSLPVTALVDQFYARVQAAGGGRYDTSSLITALQNSPHRRSPDAPSTSESS